MRLSGVQLFTGNPEDKTATIQFDEQAVDEDRIREAIRRAGHQVGV